jgi:hypothetical protein
MAGLPASRFLKARSVLPPKRPPCSSLLSNPPNIPETPVPQVFLAFSTAGSVFFFKMTLILA